MTDPYLYAHTDVLKNLLGVREKTDLQKAENTFTTMRLAKVSESNIIKQFDFYGLCQLHHYIFQDVYEWAGKPRILNIEKSEKALGGLSIEYSDCFDIARDAGHVLDDMNSFPWDKVSFDEAVKNYSHFMAGLWKVHPFREGNTRTVVTFCNSFIADRGYTINVDLYRDNAEYVRTALVAASAVFHDLGDRRKPEYLERIVRDSLKDGWQGQRKNSVLGKLKENQEKLAADKEAHDSIKPKRQVSHDDREK